LQVLREIRAELDGPVPVDLPEPSRVAARQPGRSGPRRQVIRGLPREQSIQQCAEVARAHREDGRTVAELAEQYKVESDTTIKNWIRWHDDDVAAGRWPLSQ
jgi:hypothetical protein